MRRIVISSGHGKYVSGASYYINEVTEARRVVERVAKLLKTAGVHVVEFHDDTSRTQTDNLNNIIRFHNARERDLDVSVHFNAYSPTDNPRGVEALYLTELSLAARVAALVSGASGLTDRGAKYRTDLAFLNRTNKPAIIIEVCFVDSKIDVMIYKTQFEEICRAIATSISGAVIKEREVMGQQRYDFVREIPIDRGRDTVEKLVQRGWLKGSGARLDISDDMVRGWAVNDRAGLYGR